MRGRIRSLVTMALAGVGAVCLSIPARSAGAQLVPTGSLLPCAVPMSWTVARIDPGFALSRDDALRAAREAGALWERAVGSTLFRFGDDEGSPIYFDFDARQAEIDERGQRERALESERLGIESRRREIDEDALALQSDIEEYERDAQEHGRAIRSYNNDMASASRDRDLSESRRRELARRGDDLEREGRGFEERVRELNRRSEAINDAADRLNEWIAAFGRRQQSHVGALPMSPTQAGRYDETVSWLNGETESVDRRIRIFQFSGDDDLVLTLAHELGHALGLGHSLSEGALMSEVMPADAAGLRAGGLTQTDVRMLAARCPELPAR